MFSKEFWMDTLERTIYTMAECALASLGTTAMITEVNWSVVASTTAISGIITVLKCITLETKKGNK